MATGNTDAINARADAFALDFATATLTLLSGATTLATHTLAGFGAAVGGVLTANAIADATNVADGTIDSAELTSGTKTYTLSAGGSGSGAEVIVGDTNYVTGGTSSITGLNITFPASS